MRSRFPYIKTTILIIVQGIVTESQNACFCTLIKSYYSSKCIFIRQLHELLHSFPYTARHSSWLRCMHLSVSEAKVKCVWHRWAPRLSIHCEMHVDVHDLSQWTAAWNDVTRSAAVSGRSNLLASRLIKRS